MFSFNLGRCVRFETYTDHVCEIPIDYDRDMLQKAVEKCGKMIGDRRKP